MRITLTMPKWFAEESEAWPERLASVEDRMRLVIRLARLNYERGTGGPFAAAVCEKRSGRLIAAGVNRVVPLHCSSAHAEIMALSLAQQRLATFDLGGPGLPEHQLVVNWRPCAMCYGALLWSGVRSLVLAGSDEAMERLTGFDEGPIHPEWAVELARRGVEVIDGVLRQEALEVFHDFQRSGSPVYNGRQGAV
jgi:tRNA(Arg) A34 adenosine deaminase TadA